jgi:hypothetical protein
MQCTDSRHIVQERTPFSRRFTPSRSTRRNFCPRSKSIQCANSHPRVAQDLDDPEPQWDLRYLTLLAGDLDGSRTLCGLVESRADESIANTPPVLEPKIVVVQPGLSAGQLREPLTPKSNDVGAGQVREFSTFMQNAAGGVSKVELYCSA